MKRTYVWITLALLAGSSLSFAETIRLKSGKVLEGKIIEKTPDRIKIDVNGEIMSVGFSFLSAESLSVVEKYQTTEPQLKARPLRKPVPAHPNAVFIIGQDIQSIGDYLLHFQHFEGINDAHYPDGMMAYTAINDPRGLSESVDHGAGVNFVDGLIQAYPEYNIIQIGLYMRHMLKEVTSGGLDGNIFKIGDWIKNSGKDVYLRIGYEFDNPENGYDPQEYIKAYQYIVDKFRALGISNVHFVWHTIAWTDPNWPPFDPMKWYPGDEYVDWIGISFFDCDRDAEREAVAELARTKNKPLMIAESSPFNRYSNEEKLRWMQIFFEYVDKHNVKFLSYINVNWDQLPLFESQKWGDARLQNSSVLMGAWLKEIEKYRQKNP